MTPSRFGPRAVVLAIAALGLATSARAQITPPDSLVLYPASGVQARSVYDNSLRRFVVWLSWFEASDTIATAIHSPDVTGWSLVTPPAQLTTPSMRGVYTGDTDRTIVFRSTRAATVGVDSVRIEYNIRHEETLAGVLVLVPSYVAGTFVPLTFRDQQTNQVYDFGLQIGFSAGKTDVQGIFSVGLEDFEGFHIWRGIEPDGRDLEIIGELSKEEAFKGSGTGGSIVDSVYFYSVLPALRQNMPWFSPFGAVDCLGTRIDFPLGAGQLFWYDCNAFNGFTYYYAVTTFDRGYNPGSSSQGLVKFDNCVVTTGMPYECRDQLVPLRMEVNSQDDLMKVYAVPNPYRSGSSRLTSDNYHNYPDRYIRFVNVPPSCIIKIFTVSGDLVWESTHDSGSGNIEWDVTNRDSQPVTSGVYLFRVEAPDGGSVYGRIAVIR